MIIGDLNVHLRAWLRHSSGNSPEGELLYSICNESGLKQIAREPTRANNLLDLVITDMQEASAIVGPKIRDHNYVIVDLGFTMPETTSVQRTVWDYKKADWDQLPRYSPHCSNL